MPKALLLENIHPDAAKSLRDHGFEVETMKGALSEDELIDALDGVDLVGVRSKTNVTARVLDARPTLSAIGCFCIGTNQVDLAHAGKRGIAVFNAPYSNTRSVVELVICDIICLMRRIPAHTHHIKHGLWDKSASGSHEVRGKTLGIIDKNINWLGDERFALGCIILILLTTSVGQPIVLYVSALGNVDQSIVEAAEVDGANDFQCFWKIKWPAIMPTTLYILVITTINSFQCFALIQLLTSGGPNHSTDTIMYYIYYTAFKLYRYGYGNAMGVVLAVIIAILSAVQFKLGNQDN